MRNQRAKQPTQEVVPSNRESTNAIICQWHRYIKQDNACQPASQRSRWCVANHCIVHIKFVGSSCNLCIHIQCNSQLQRICLPVLDLLYACLGGGIYHFQPLRQ